MSWFIYILLCSDGSLYVGYTKDLEQRVATHNAGKGAAHTALRRPVKLVYSEPFESEPAAVAREIQLKKWSRAKKEALIASDKAQLHVLAKRRT
jgi:predicted GIY-YIG superfamily endonuclease